MKALLLANVGNSDLFLPDDIHPRGDDGKKLFSRQLGETILTNFKRYRDSIRLPLIGPCLKLIKDELGIEYSDIGLCLFASDQDRNLTLNADDWRKDTRPIAEVIQEYLNYHYKIPKKAVSLYTIEGNPADYSNAFAFHAAKLVDIKAWLDHKHLAPKIYLEISGGTPAMVSMLLLMGIGTFGQDVVTLYKDQSSSEPDSIDVSQKLFARNSRELLRTQIGVYAYGSARESFQQNAQVILSDERMRQNVAHLLDYADRRLAFDFEGARTALRQIHAVGELQAQVRLWRNLLEDTETSKNVAELIHLAEVKLALHQYAEFTQILFRFQESVFRHLAGRMGMETTGRDGQFMQQSWRESNRALDGYLKNYRRTGQGKPSETPTQVETDGTLNRYNLGAVVDYFVTHEPQWAELKDPVEEVFKLSSVAELRNKGIAGHGFEGVGDEDIVKSYGAPSKEIILRLKQVYQQIFGDALAESPYTKVNELITALIEVPS